MLTVVCERYNSQHATVKAVCIYNNASTRKEYVYEHRLYVSARPTICMRNENAFGKSTKESQPW
ncbi:unnamed protein product [Periconia digitata]|uniref:Uncharacterized protein n=1 Tax=Periconia digitata TaxID=1303443 RepID=A0A9W4XQP6_9PLEO|nr:unnamed protein product [Periconia digitata]